MMSPIEAAIAAVMLGRGNKVQIFKIPGPLSPHVSGVILVIRPHFTCGAVCFYHRATIELHAVNVVDTLFYKVQYDGESPN
jgi:hypothetical protein